MGCVQHAYRFIVCVRYIYSWLLPFSIHSIASIFGVFIYYKAGFFILLYLAFLLTIFFSFGLCIQCASSVTFFGYCFLAVATSYQAKHMADVYWGETLSIFLFYFFPCFFVLFFYMSPKLNQHKSIVIFDFPKCRRNCLTTAFVIASTYLNMLCRTR